MAMGEELGVDVKYDRPSEALVSGQVAFINKFVNQGNAIAISSLSPDGLCESLKRAEEKGAKVLTWDADVNPECRSYDINQGTPEQLGRLLVTMTADQMVADRDQPEPMGRGRQGGDRRRRPELWIVATESSIQDSQKAVQVPTALCQTSPDPDAIICPDANALPGSAQAAEIFGVAGKIIIAGYLTPNIMRQ